MYKVKTIVPWFAIYNDAGEYIISLNDKTKAEIICELLNQDQSLGKTGKVGKRQLVYKNDYVGVS